MRVFKNETVIFYGDDASELINALSTITTINTIKWNNRRSPFPKNIHPELAIWRKVEQFAYCHMSNASGISCLLPRLNKLKRLEISEDPPVGILMNINPSNDKIGKLEELRLATDIHNVNQIISCYNLQDLRYVDINLGENPIYTPTYIEALVEMLKALSKECKHLTHLTISGDYLHKEEVRLQLAQLIFDNRDTLVNIDITNGESETIPTKDDDDSSFAVAIDSCQKLRRLTLRKMTFGNMSSWLPYLCNMHIMSLCIDTINQERNTITPDAIKALAYSRCVNITVIAWETVDMLELIKEQLNGRIKLKLSTMYQPS